MINDNSLILARAPSRLTKPNQACKEDTPYIFFKAINSAHLEVAKPVITFDMLKTPDECHIEDSKSK